MAENRNMELNEEMMAEAAEGLIIRRDLKLATLWRQKSVNSGK